MSDPRCRCGVYERVHREGHPRAHLTCGNYREASRLRLWFMDHSVWRHVVGWVWLSLPSKARWRIVRWFDRPGVCWCDLVDAAWKPGNCRDDFQRPNGCGCDVPLPWDAGVPRPGECYCAPERSVS